MEAAVANPRARLHAKAVDPRSAAFAVAFGAVSIVGVLDGGYYTRSWIPIALGLGAVGGLRLVVGDPYPDLRALLSLAALAGLATWMLLSSRWGIRGTQAVREASRCAMYAAGFGAVLVLARPATARALLMGVLGGGALLGLVALAERVLTPRPPDPFEGTLLVGTVGYANALGILVALSLVIAIGLRQEECDPRVRVGLLAVACVSVLALALTSSRGAWLASLVGVLVLAGFKAPRRTLVAAAIAAAALCTFVAVAAPSLPLGDRGAYWRVAAEDASANPLVGSGAGSFDDYWVAHRPIPAYVQDAHSIYLETAAELGVVGLVLLACALLMPLSAAVAARQHPLAPVAAAAYVTFLVHAGLDWDWEMPATTLAGLTCAAALVGIARRS